VTRSQPRGHSALPDLEHGRLPDAIGESLAILMEHVKELEERITGHARLHGPMHAPPLHLPEHGVWHGEDFSI
jgi:hypothetical protein